MALFDFLERLGLLTNVKRLHAVIRGAQGGRGRVIELEIEYIHTSEVAIGSVVTHGSQLAIRTKKRTWI